MKIAVIGAGHVGRALGALAARAGHTLSVGVRDERSASTQAVRRELPTATLGTVTAAVQRSELILLTTPFAAAAEVLTVCGDLAGRIVVDCTNPIGPGLVHVGGERSGAEILAATAPSARMVKAFNVYGVENLADPVFGDATLRGMMPVAGDDPAAKAAVIELATQMGWEAVDVGGLAQALHLEHLALLWIRMARIDGHPPRFVWARLTAP